MARARRSPDSGGAVEEVVAQDAASGPQTASNGHGEAPEGQKKAPPPLPQARTRTGDTLEAKTLLLYGPPGIGKTTIASEWADGEVFFFNTAGELNDFDVYQQPIESWRQFREYCWALAENPGQFKAAAIDTADVLGLFCTEHIRKKLGISHESDAEWGKGWAMLREEFQLAISKLASIPNLGLILISHAKDVEIKTRSSTYDKSVPTLTGGVRDVCLNMPDLVIHLDWSGDDERVFHTKPSPYYEAKERGSKPRLAAEIPWPLGESGYAILRKAWEEGAK